MGAGIGICGRCDRVVEGGRDLAGEQAGTGNGCGSCHYVPQYVDLAPYRTFICLTIHDCTSYGDHHVREVES